MKYIVLFFILFAIIIRFNAEEQKFKPTLIKIQHVDMNEQRVIFEPYISPTMEGVYQGEVPDKTAAECKPFTEGTHIFLDCDKYIIGLQKVDFR